MKYAYVLGRAFYSLVFIIEGFKNFSKQTIEYAVKMDVTAALVPMSGIIAITGGLSILLGFRARFGAWLLVLFLIPVSILIHNFWVATDVNTVQLQQIMFLKNLSMFGGALLIIYCGSGPVSIDGFLKARHDNKVIGADKNL